ncbi:WecB/TagA/CpsF family glycosyltransferase [Roseovarius sp. D0-M9]|uniref:WecB/TagA/CpsF family glycosyltransferase n=1 Tax=Roseovarius sp. D0-M9 TaxID=3127117 RepID=UPI00300FBD3B
MFLITANGRKVAISHPRRAALLEGVHDHLRRRAGFRMATVNLDHMVQIGSDDSFAAAYAQHDIIVADGRPIRWLSQLAGDPVELMPGSDMIVPLAEVARDTGRPIALIGSTEAVLGGAEAYLRKRVPGLEVAYSHAPAMGFDPSGAPAAEVLGALEESGAGLCFLALGAPKQERLAARGAALAPSVGLVSIGAGLDFLAGHQRRAPHLMRALALEWLWRAMTNPARLVPRYARCAAILPGLALRAWKAR